MIRPVRLRLAQTKGFDLQALSRATNGLPAVKVDRSTRWGNPFDFRAPDFCWIALAFGCSGGPAGRREASVLAFREWVTPPAEGKRVLALERRVVMTGPKACEPVQVGAGVAVGAAPAIADLRAALGGRNLACWCGDGPCHVDVYLELANP